jgi:uncharacterized repeat protein (TIGR01451 family)
VRDGPTDTDGIAFLLKNPSMYPTVGVVSSAAYSVINHCALGCELHFAHELGHNMGNAHDRATVARDNNGVVATEGVFSYSFGHYDCANGLTCNPFVPGGCPVAYAQCAAAPAGDFGTIMSYMFPRLMKFSNPDTRCFPAGVAAPGRPCGVAGEADDALSMNNTRQNVSAFRSQTLGDLPGSIQFVRSGYANTESGGAVTFTVHRTGGASGFVTVDYYVAGGSAMPGVDFPVTSGTLTWAHGDASDKTISVPMTADLASEGIESFKATLWNASGAAGIYLGYPTTAVGLILETWPPGAAIPPGWGAAQGSSSAWAIATDSSFDFDGASLKSGAMNFDVANCTHPSYGAIPCPSALQHTGTFPNGEIAYAYRVNSYPGSGYFEFLVDGSVVHAATGSVATGDSGWQVFSTPVSAGTHTLVWRYRTILPFPCSAAIPLGAVSAPYPGCLDRAWLDAVSLPLVLSDAPTSLTSSPNPSYAGQPATLTAVVSGGSGTPTGSVSFRDGSTVIPGCGAVALAAGRATCVTTALPVGVRSISAVYSGNTTYAISSMSAFHTINAGVDLSVSQAANPGTGNVGKDVIFTITTANSGPMSATNVAITNTLPAGVVYVWSSPGCTLTGSTMNCAVGTLGPGASAERKLVIRPASTGVTTNTASVSTPDAETTLTNNSVSTNVTIAATPAGVPVLRYRLYSPVSLEHHFTTDLNEYNVLGASGAWVQEGTVGRVLNNPGTFNGVAAVPYYRLYNTFTRWHHWTTDANEYYTLVTFPGWGGEGVDGYILPTNTGGAMELYRLVYPNGTGLHHWTVDNNEYVTLINTYGWVGEGGAGFVIQ